MLSRWVLLVHVLAAIVLAVQACRTPLGNWDIVAYTALVKSADGLHGEALSRATYGDVQAYLGPAYPRVLPEGNEPRDRYRAAMHDSPAALEENLRFYVVKPLYIGASRAVAALAGNAALATVIVSSAALFAFVAAFPFFFPQVTVWAIAGTWLLVLTGSLPIVLLASSATPDSLGLLFAGAACLWAVQLRHGAWVAAAGVLAVLARPDTMMLIGPLLVGCAWLDRRKKGANGGAVWLGIAAVLSVLFLYLSAQYVPWSTLMRHTFHAGIAHPVAGVAPITASEYIDIVKQTLPVTLNARVCTALAAGLALAVVPSLLGRANLRAQWLAVAALVNMVAHYVLLPLDEFGFERLFIGSYFMLLASALMWLPAKVRP